jgi:hypothetical protein
LPDNLNDNYFIWYYSSDYVRFDVEGKVDFIGNFKRSFNISPMEKETGASKITWGSTKDDVVRLLGEPTSISKANSFYGRHDRTSWTYAGYQYVNFNESGKVVYWSEDFTAADTWKADPNAAPVTIGSTIETVSTALGCPDNFSSTETVRFWKYGTSTVSFDLTGKVYEWENNDNLNISIAEKNPSAPPFTKGSSIYDVALVLGTPKIIKDYAESYLAFYDNTVVNFDLNYKVIDWYKQ